MPYITIIKDLKMGSIGQSHKVLQQAKKNRSNQYISRKSLRVEAWRADIENEISEGWTGYGQTNHLLKTIACQGVVFEGLTNEALVEYVIQTAIACPGYETWCRHQHEIRSRCTLWARSAEGYYWQWGTAPKRQGNLHSLEAANAIVPFDRSLNQQRAEAAQQRISQAFAQLVAENALPNDSEVRAQAIITIARCSKQTLGKYKDLWHPAHSPSSPVCTVEPVSTAIEASPLQELELLEPLSEKGVHTFSSMKGEAASGCVALDFHLFCSGWGGLGGYPQAWTRQTMFKVTQILSKRIHFLRFPLPH